MKVILKNGIKVRVSTKEANILIGALMDEDIKDGCLSLKMDGVRYKIFKLSDISAVI